MAWGAIDYNGNYVEVEDDVANVVKEVRRLWPELKVQYVENPGIDQKPWRITETTKDGLELPVIDLWELDHRVIELLHQADTHRHGIKVLERLDASNQAVRTVAANNFANWRELFVDLIKHMGNHTGSTYTFKDPHTDEIVKVTDS